MLNEIKVSKTKLDKEATFLPLHKYREPEQKIARQ